MKVFLLPTERRDKVQYIYFKELIITHVLAYFKHPADIMKLANTGSIHVIPLPTFTNVMNKYGFTYAYTTTTEEK